MAKRAHTCFRAVLRRMTLDRKLCLSSLGHNVVFIVQEIRFFVGRGQSAVRCLSVLHLIIQISAVFFIVMNNPRQIRTMWSSNASRVCDNDNVRDSLICHPFACRSHRDCVLIGLTICRLPSSLSSLRLQTELARLAAKVFDALFHDVQLILRGLK